VTIRLHEAGVKAIVLDIEGTTTPIAFVHDVLFPYARARLHEFLAVFLTTPGGRAWLERFHEEWRAGSAGGETPAGWRRADASPLTAAVEYACWLMDRDRKSRGLKELQGLIWKDGYDAGELTGDVYPDVPVAFERWRAAGIVIAIYSSGSVLAQRLLFGRTPYGDLTRLLGFFFDTGFDMDAGIGRKVAPDSYKLIANKLGRETEEMLFVSDAVAELTAARAAGMQVALSVRPGNPPQPAIESPVVTSFDEIGA
jgi:enolase-phosphatase E1